MPSLTPQGKKFGWMKVVVKCCAIPLRLKSTVDFTHRLCVKMALWSFESNTRVCGLGGFPCYYRKILEKVLRYSVRFKKDYFAKSSPEKKKNKKNLICMLYFRSVIRPKKRLPVQNAATRVSKMAQFYYYKKNRNFCQM
jgi:hypothetical protein